MSSAEPLTIPPGHSKLSIDEYSDLPKDGKRYEIIDGELYVSPAPVPRHQKISIRLVHYLYEALELSGKGELYAAPTDVIFDRFNICQPDLIYVARENVEIIGADAIEGPPDLLVEILSPSTRRTDVLIKSTLYARFGVRFYWLVDPDIDQIEFFRLEGGEYRQAGSVRAPGIAESPGFPGLMIPLDKVFG